MSAGLLKPEKDFTKDADKLIPEAESLAKVSSAMSIWKNEC
jgi:26S proteasome regulatory subunit N5